MCYSAKASFVSSGVLGVVGALSLRHVSSPGMVYFAAVPSLFALQQASEGVIWLTGPGERWPRIHGLATTLFMIAAFCAWPVYMPLAAWALEPDAARRWVMLALAAAGLVVALRLWFVFVRHRVPAMKLYKHIVYDADAEPKSRLERRLERYVYVASTTVPFLISSRPWLWLWAVLLFVSFVAAARWYRRWQWSVWCFFAAALSATIPILLHLG